MGQTGSDGTSALRLYNSEGSSQFTDYKTDKNPLNADALYTWIKNGSSNTFSMNNSTVSATNSLTHSKIRKLSISNNSIKELKVKPL